MIRTLVLCVCVAALCGCSSTRKTVTNGSPGSAEKVAAEPKQYQYRDMSRGGSTFARGIAANSNTYQP